MVVHSSTLLWYFPYQDASELDMYTLLEVLNVNNFLMNEFLIFKLS